MKNYQPTYGVRETAQNIKFFVEANQSVMWVLFKPLLPYILVLHAMDAVITTLYFPNSETGFSLGSLIAAYFLTCLAVGWHRVVILGVDHATPMDPFNPKRSELAFIGMGMALALMVFALVFVMVLVFAVLGKLIGGGQGPVASLLMAIGIFASIAGGMYLAYKVSFYFPAKAADADLTFRKSFDLTRGYFWKMVAAPLLASTRLLALLFVYVFLMFFVLTMIFTATGYEDGTMPMVDMILFFLSLPVVVYFQPILTVIGVTGLSNYYMHAMQHRTDAQTP